MEQDSASTPHHKSRNVLVDPELAAIFVHAGAGFHSRQNAGLHLGACANACTAAMAFLKSGATAVDAVEVAIKSLEDNDMTNAGYGSNLAMDGTVEGDATIVDHFGRSGAVGALPGVLNPIHVARLILDESIQPLSLKRVAPNLLVAQGAQDYAFCQHVPVLPNDALVSPPALERWKKWSNDLVESVQRRDDRAAQMDNTALQNEGQDKSPVPSSAFPTSSPGNSPSVAYNAPQPGYEFAHHIMTADFTLSKRFTEDPKYDGANDCDESFGGVLPDTVGAIAVDGWGNIAAGSSSGGIGMKYKGRVGPAALVGVGSAVVSANPDDIDKTCSAAVCSGTGEHMATTLAASTSANRVHHCKTVHADGSVHEANETDALANFVKVEFLRHQSVITSVSSGAIGIMSVKRTEDGIHVYWAHNTESFALASMTSEDAEPNTVMSRAYQKRPGAMHNQAIVTSGGRSMPVTGIQVWPTLPSSKKSKKSDTSLHPPTR